MGIILNAIQKTLDEQGKGARLLGSEKRVLETGAQAKYNDVRKVERNYTRGVHNSIREKARADSVLSNLKAGRKFTGQNGAFSGTVTPCSVNESTNSLSVELYLQGGSTWHEDWNLQHTIWGFENRDYKWID